MTPDITPSSETTQGNFFLHTSTTVSDKVAAKTWELLDDHLSPEEFEQLNLELSSSPEALKAYVSAVQLHVDLQEYFGRQSDLSKE